MWCQAPQSWAVDPIGPKSPRQLLLFAVLLFMVCKGFPWLQSLFRGFFFFQFLGQGAVYGRLNKENLRKFFSVSASIAVYLHNLIHFSG